MNDEWFEAPPCLNALAEDGSLSQQGYRNSAFYAVCVYLKRRYPDDWQDRTYAYVQRHLEGSPPIGDRISIVRSLERRDLDYPCYHPPCSNACDFRTCVTRRFGVLEAPVSPRAPLSYPCTTIRTARKLTRGHPSVRFVFVAFDDDGEPVGRRVVEDFLDLKDMTSEDGSSVSVTWSAYCTREIPAAAIRAAVEAVDAHVRSVVTLDAWRLEFSDADDLDQDRFWSRKTGNLKQKPRGAMAGGVRDWSKNAGGRPRKPFT